VTGQFHATGIYPQFAQRLTEFGIAIDDAIFERQQIVE